MSWGGGWGNAIPQSGRDVAAAFYAGRTLKRSSCRTDGTTYWFIDSRGSEIDIARRLREDHIPGEIADALAGRPHRRPLEFSTRGWRTQTTARHLVCLGLKAQACSVNGAKRFKINGRFMPDDWSGWFDRNDIASWPTEHPDDKVVREARERRELARQYRQGRKFVQMTPSLFDLGEEP